MLLSVRFAAAGAVLVALFVSGCTGNSGTSTTATPIPTTQAEKQQAAQGEVNKSMDMMRQTMEASGKTPAANMPGFQLPPPPGGVGGPAPKGVTPTGTPPTGSAPAGAPPNGNQ